MRKIYVASDAARVFDAKEFVAIKLHVGEEKNTTHVRPELIRELVDKVNEKSGLPFFNRKHPLYIKGKGENAVKHSVACA